jgi:septal ring factor EnvC (AmiA/AmiB activator)
MTAGVTITTQQMYELLLQVDRKVTAMGHQHQVQASQLADHEERLRNIEAEEDLSRRIGDLETDIKAMSAQIEDMKKRLWAIPGASAIIAAAAVILTLVRTY